ncbi:hypothetical protein AGMMS49992_11730 [Clostridia bacterium]|nr:hypothetical protein AGMMS49992_11730 [Clostridia bacterium]
MANDLILADNAAEPATAALAAVAPVYTGYMVLANKRQMNEVAAEMNKPGFVFDCIQNPAVGGTTFEVTDSNGEKISVQEYTGVVVHYHSLNTYYEKDYDSAHPLPPDCYSIDGVTGVGTPGGACEDCPNNVFSSGKNGKGKACKNKVRLFILLPGNWLPTLAHISATNLRAFSDYRAFLTTHGGVPHGVETTISIDRKSKGSYVTFIFKKERNLSKDERAVTDNLAAYIKAYILKIRNASEYLEATENIDPVTGEVTRPLTEADIAEYDAAIEGTEVYISPYALPPTVGEVNV